MEGVVIDIKPVVDEGRLRALATVRSPELGSIEARLPDRELAALLPRRLLLGNGTRAPKGLLATARPILRRFVVQRDVRVWEHNERFYFAFPSWRSVRFVDAPEADCEEADFREPAQPAAEKPAPATSST